MAFDFNSLFSPAPGRPVAVAEIGTAHGGDLRRGLDLVDAAADAGADVAKVQVVFAREILPPQAGMVPLPGGDTPLYEVFESLERPPEFYAALAERAEKRGLGFLASPFGETSVRLLEQIGVMAWKVASPELNHEPLLRRLAGTGLPMILSTGVSLPGDIRRALEVIAAAVPDVASPAGLKPPVLLHCLTSYPAPEDQANMLAVPALRRRFGTPVGFSDHSLDPAFLPSLAVSLGAVLVEKHITLSRDTDGLDDRVALTPEAFTEMTSAMRRWYRPSPAPGGNAADISGELIAEFGSERVTAALGDGSLGLAPAEEALYGRTNRSLHAVGGLPKGTVVTEENTAVLRTEKVLRPGIPPRYLDAAYGRRLKRDVAPGDGITRDDLE